MGKILVKAKLWNFLDEAKFKEGLITKDKIRIIELVDVLVDTGATMLTLPEEIVEKLGLMIVKEVTATYANGIKEKKKVAAPIAIEILGRSFIGDCIVENKGTKVLVGQIPLEEMDLVIDPKKNILGPRPESPDMPLIEIY